MAYYPTETDDTIAAIATPIGKGAISIIRVSGNKALSILSLVFEPASKFKNLKKSYLIGNIISDNKVIDKVVVWVKKGKNSYTGEDLVEVNCHGNPIITNLILDLIISKGARVAGPGEFTLRAFLNNKLDLIQAEAINDLINASSYSSIELSINNILGRLSDKIRTINESLKKILVNIEVALDHSEEDFIPYDPKFLKNEIYQIILNIDKFIESYKIGKELKHGISLSIIGKANVGKSSLFNLLIKRDKAIISHIAGTTRDVVEEYVEIDDFPIKLLDTAGIKKIAGHIEKEALKRTYKSIKSSNILLVLFDNSEELTNHDYLLAKEISQLECYKLIIINKCDLRQKINLNQLKNMFSDKEMIKISVSRETGIKKIEKKIVKYIKKFDLKNKLIINNLRHKTIFMNTNIYLKNVVQSLKNNYYFDVVASDLKKALNELGKLTGEYTTEKVLDDIFSNFCIGK